MLAKKKILKQQLKYEVKKKYKRFSKSSKYFIPALLLSSAFLWSGKKHRCMLNRIINVFIAVSNYFFRLPGVGSLNRISGFCKRLYVQWAYKMGVRSSCLQHLKPALGVAICDSLFFFPLSGSLFRVFFLSLRANKPLQYIWIRVTPFV